jgi:enoyl-CoA hydratase/carnithine racemase
MSEIMQEDLMATTSIQMDIQEHIAIVRLSHGTTNAIELELVHELHESLQNLEADPEVHGLALTSANEKFFSIGFNIPELIELPPDNLRTFYRSFSRMCLDLFTLPKPTIAVIPGHAIAGGCILALCCDYRFIAEGRKLMGLNEIKLGLPVPYVADCILRELVGLRHARDIMDSGNFFAPEQSLQMGMVDKILPADKLLAEAINSVKELSSYPQAAFAMIKQNRIEGIRSQILSGLEKKEEHFIQCWLSREAQALLREAMTKF